jgi:pSer/pThr/pTyr-binding forkhead associated (FHA) protein
MQPEVVLTYVDEAGRAQSVAVAPARFTVGRGTDNDLAVGDSNLSRRHAIIERAGGSVLISDCGSRNGTAVNDHPVRGEVELTDGDSVTLGGSFQFTVKVNREAPAPDRRRLPSRSSPERRSRLSWRRPACCS